ncbi:MAG TPA: PilZ domain-containing protein [Steroidobacteraceae bacterium]|nr:PilZ domain-containing protein [Steroidobacteraceae bacterium]
MYEGVDTVILNNELAYEDLLPMAFKPLARPLDAAAAGALADRNMRLLQVCAAIEEHGAVERKDEASPHSADLLRLEVKVNLLLDLMGQVLAAQVPRPAPAMLRFNAQGAQWKTLDPPRVGAQGMLEVWLRDCLPQPLGLIANIASVAADGMVKATLTPPGEAVADLIEKLAFRRHRRHVAGVRQPRRSGSETTITRTRG